MPSFTLEESDFAGYLPDDTVLAARVANIKIQEKPFTDDDGNKVKKVVWKFNINEPDGQYAAWDGQAMYGETSIRFVDHPDCKLRAWSQSVMAIEMPPGYNLDTDVMVGMDCRVVVKLDEWEDKTTGEPKQRNKIGDVMPSRAAALASAGAAEEPF